MALQHDIASTSAAPDTRVRRPGTQGLADEAAIEQEYLAHREAVLSMLRSKFPRLPDHEDIFQEAWTELLQRRFVRRTTSRTSGSC